MKYSSVAEMKESLAAHVRFAPGSVQVLDPEAFRTQDLDRLVYTAVFGNEETKAASRWVIWEAAQQLGALPASIQGLYETAPRGTLNGRTVPAMNLRGMTYDMARAAVRAALKEKVGAFIFELARSEMGYTYQRPAEYATVVLAAALREGFRGPVFIQGDHFQVNAKAYAKDSMAETRALESLIVEALEAGWYNIDIDASTLVDVSKPTLEEQQALNAQITADLTSYIRQNQPEGVTVSVGGEIGEVGGHNSTVEELRTFMNEYRERLGPGKVGISKISVQTGTTHGGVVLPDGTIARVKLDFERLAQLSRIAREEYGLAGAVQHGASTLPDEAFDKFPQTGTAEVHLATGFQNIVFNSPAFPSALKEKAYAYLRENYAKERKPSETDEQFYYSNRKRVWGPLKEEMWNLPASTREQIGAELEAEFGKLYRKLGVADSVDLVNSTVKPVSVHKPAKVAL